MLGQGGHQRRGRRVRVVAAEHRSQRRNRKAARERLAEHPAFSDADVDVIAYACLVAVMAQGPNAHRESEEVIASAARENGHPAAVASSAGALVRTLQELGARRIAMVAPYMLPLTRMVREYIEGAGIEVVDAISLEVDDNLAVGALDPQNLPGIARGLKRDGVDAVILSACVQMPSLPAVQTVEDELGLPVITAATATTYEILKALGQEPAIAGAGGLLSGAYTTAGNG